MSRFPTASRFALSAAGLLFAAMTATAQTAQPPQSTPPAPAPYAQPMQPSQTMPSESQEKTEKAEKAEKAEKSEKSAKAGGETRLHEADQAFITDGTKGVSTQRDAARIANSRSADSQVKSFAARVAADDEKISREMRAASPRGVDVPHNDPDDAVLAGIKDLRGDAFDKVYIEQVALNGEQKTLSAFQAEIASGRDPKLTNAARQALPVLQAHYAEAQKLAQRKHLGPQ